MSLKEDISRILGPEKVSGAPDVLAAHAGDKWYASVLPEAVVSRKVRKTSPCCCAMHPP